MSTRAAAVEVTRERILQAASDAFMRRWYDDVTLRDIAADAGVALQTLVNHFGNKEALFGVAAERISETISTLRWTVAVGDFEGGDHPGRRLRGNGRLHASHARDRGTLSGRPAGSRARAAGPPGVGRARFRCSSDGVARR